MTLTRKTKRTHRLRPFLRDWWWIEGMRGGEKLRCEDGIEDQIEGISVRIVDIILEEVMRRESSGLRNVEGLNWDSKLQQFGRRMQAIPGVLTGIIKGLPTTILAKLSKRVWVGERPQQNHSPKLFSWVMDVAKHDCCGIVWDFDVVAIRKILCSSIVRRIGFDVF